MEIDPGTVVANRYRISRPLGRGGMGEVFAAENIRTGRPVAVKLLRSESKAKSSAVARFRREARAAGSINSDHVTEILDVEEDAEHGIVLVFELLEGESLIDRLKRTGPIPFDELHGIVEQVWIGLADAHKAGIIHRDLKPSNVFLERRPDGQTRVKILDFGISKLPKEMGGETLTEMGQSLGTFSFMPPEQIGKAKTVDHRADIYACATLIYQAMSGQLPYAARNILVMVEMKSKTDARKLADAMGDPVDPRLESFLSQALARDPGQRFQSALEALTAWRDLRPQGVPPAQKDRSLTPAGGTLAMPHLQSPAAPSRPIEPVIRQPEPSRSAASLPLLNETTSDTAATLAMPLSHFTAQEMQRRDSPAGGVQAVRQDANSRPAALSKTLPIRSDAPSSSPHAQQQPMRAPTPVPGSVRPESGPISSNQYQLPPQRPLVQSGGNFSQGPAANSQAASRPSGQVAISQSSSGLPRMYDEGTSNPPASQEKTQIYVPQQSAATPQARRADAALVTSPSLARQMEAEAGGRKKRGAAPLIAGALAFAVVGFAIVAAILHYMGRGWP